MTHHHVEFPDGPAGSAAVSRRTLIQRCGALLLAPLALSSSAGTASAATRWGAPVAADPVIDAAHCLDVCLRRDQEYARAGEAAFQRDLAAVELRYQQRLADCPLGEGAAVYRAACEQERAELLAVAHASREEWFARRKARLADMLRRCGVPEGR